MSPTSEQEKAILDALIRNSLRHLSRGLESFDADELDFAVTNTFLGIEVLLKALVFDGRWEFIFDEPGDADIVKLEAGNGRTIGWEQAGKRLRTLIGKPLPPSCASFKMLQKHRNKLVHCFHPGLTSKAEKTEVAKDIANAWAALRELRALPAFESVFRDHEAGFRDLEARLLIVEGYLDQQEKIVLSTHPHAGRLETCPACKRKAFNGDCAICGYYEPSHHDIRHGAEPIENADCPACGEKQAVVNCEGGSRCTKCGTAFGFIHACEYCGTILVPTASSDRGEGEGSYYFGCWNCRGHLGELTDRD